MFPNAPQIQLAMFHTIFNLATVIIVLPLTGALVKLVAKIIPDKKGMHDDAAPRLYFIDERMLKTPPIAVAQVKNEIINMAEIAVKNFCLSCDMICSLDYTEIEKFRSNEKELNFLNREIAGFVVKLLKSELSEKDRIYLSTSFHSVTDLERVGDYAENIVEYADKLKAENEKFSDTALEEILHLKELIKSLYDEVIQAYRDGDLEALYIANVIEDEVDNITNKMGANHIQRLNDGVCTPDVGAQYLSLSANAERVADHFINVGKTIKEYI
jgi:phosphate:Na+ symporter